MSYAAVTIVCMCVCTVLQTDYSTFVSEFKMDGIIL